MRYFGCGLAEWDGCELGDSREDFLCPWPPWGSCRDLCGCEEQDPGAVFIISFFPVLLFPFCCFLVHFAALPSFAGCAQVHPYSSCQSIQS